MDSFVGGVAMGFAIAAPVGPIGILCLRRAVVGGFFAGLSSGLGAACADAAYAALALGALTFVAAVIARLMVPLHLVGGVALILLGLRTACSVLPRASGDVVSARAGWRALVTTFGLTIVNPATILSFGAVVAAAQFGRGVDGRGAAALVVGVFVGSALWSERVRKHRAACDFAGGDACDRCGFGRGAWRVWRVGARKRVKG